MSKQLSLLDLKQTLPLPQYFPDGTLGVVRSLDSQDLAQVGIQGLVVNTFHLRQQPGIKTLTQLGGIKKLMNWKGLITSDSGGFQLFSLIQKHPDMGKIIDEGVVLYHGKNKQSKEVFTPEKSIQLQFAIGSDIMICLDDFTPDTASPARIKRSVWRTIKWAGRCKTEFEIQLKQYGFSKKRRPILLAPIQGHRNFELRKKCAQELIQIEFDGYGLGGWPFKPNGKFDYEMSQINADLTPNHKLRFALGIGKPENIVQLHHMGYDLFDCVLPTRDARHKRLYVFTQDPALIDFNQNEKWYDYLYLDRGSFKHDQQPLSQFCDCPTCRHYTRAYLYHLFKIKDATAHRLATLHNLRFYARLMEKLQTED
jgi:queuine tRNA-ribosyltransferase